MKALNTKERNSSILKFSIWLLTGVLIISIPIIFSSFMSSNQQNVKDNESNSMVEDVEFEREYMAVKIQEIIGLMASKDDGELEVDSFNAKLDNILTDIKTKTENNITWRGDMHRNIVAISQVLVTANKIVSSSGEDKEDLVSGLEDIIVEIEGSKDELADLSKEKKRKILQKGINEVKRDLQKAIKKLNNFKAGIK